MSQNKLFLLPVLLALLPVACAHQSRRAPADSPPPPPVSLHDDIDQTVSVGPHHMQHTADGRLSIRVMLQSSKGTDLSVIAQTTWFDERGAVVEMGKPRTLVLPSATPVAFDDATFSTRATAYTVSVRPSTTHRR